MESLNVFSFKKNQFCKSAFTLRGFLEWKRGLLSHLTTDNFTSPAMYSLYLPTPGYSSGTFSSMYESGLIHRGRKTVANPYSLSCCLVISTGNQRAQSGSGLPALGPDCCPRGGRAYRDLGEAKPLTRREAGSCCCWSAATTDVSL